MNKDELFKDFIGGLIFGEGQTIALSLIHI